MRALSFLFIMTVVSLFVVERKALPQSPERTLGFARQEIQQWLTLGDSVTFFRLRAQKVEVDVGKEVPERTVNDLYCQVQEAWDSPDKLTFLHVESWVRSSSERAKRHFDLRRARSAAVGGYTALATGRKLGDQCDISTDGGFISFRVGRVLVDVVVGMENRRENPPAGIFDGVEDVVAEAVATRVEYMLRQQPKLAAVSFEPLQFIVKGKPSVTSSPVLALDRTHFGPITALRSGGAEIDWQPKTNTGHITYRDKTVDFTALSRKANVNGTQFTLAAPVFVHEGEPIVPLQSLTQALGLQLKEVGKGRIELAEQTRS